MASGFTRYKGTTGGTMKKYEKNVNKNYLFVFFSNINFTSGLWMIYLAKSGFSLVELGILESIFHIGSMIFEIPSGAVADLIGRKYCRLAGRLALLASLVIMYTARSFSIQAVGFLICAFGYNLESGAGEAFVYDSLKLAGRDDSYKKVAGFIELSFQAGYLVSYAVGGFLASGAGYFYVFLFSGLAALVSFMTGLTFHEDKRGTSSDEGEGGENERDGFFRILAKSIRLLAKRPRILFLIIFSETVFVFTTTLFFYLQNFFKEEGLPEKRIGLIYAAASILSALSAVSASRIERKTGEKKLLVMLPLVLVLCLFGVALTDFKAVFFVLTGFIEGVLIVVISDYLNRMIPSDIRATVLSFQSMIFSLLMIVLFPAAGVAAQMLSFETAFLLMAVVSAFFTAAYIIIQALRSRAR